MDTTDIKRAWCTAAASVTGAGHRKAGSGCQDAHACCTAGGLLLLAAADGAGSAARSEVGAAEAVRAVLENLERQAADITAQNVQERLEEALAFAKQQVEQKADEMGHAPRDLAATLLVAVLHENYAAAIQVGDGAIVALNCDGTLQALTRPPLAEYANETTFLTAHNALQEAQFALLEQPLAGLALFTDGLQRLALHLPEGEPHLPFFAPLFRFASSEADPQRAALELERFLGSPRIQERADDDLTLLLAARPPAS